MKAAMKPAPAIPAVLRGRRSLATALVLLVVSFACSASSSAGRSGGAGGAGGAAAGGGAGGSSATGGGGLGNFDGGQGDPDATFEGDPVTCEHAAAERTYVGCDFWPTVLPNFVGTHFDYAVVVANAGPSTAKITIERGGTIVATGDVPPNGLRKFFPPWVPELKRYLGACDTDLTPPSLGLDSSVSAPDGAYHLTSSVPVTVYQFNPLEYKGAGGPDGKDWSKCQCLFGCNSYTNDASLLLPSTALTGNYLVTAQSGIDTADLKAPGYIAVTAFEQDTVVTVKVGERGRVLAGAGTIPPSGPGDVFSFRMNRGEVVLLTGTADSDLGGTRVQADKPVQVMSGMPCTYLPHDRQACDHLEETVFPVETLGKRYFVARPTGPVGAPVGHFVRLYGNVDGTSVSYPAGAPPGAPTVLDGGKTYDLGAVNTDFEIVADHELAVATFQQGNTVVDPDIFASRGDPSQSTVASVEQYRKKYVFLAPSDYDVSFVDIVVPDGATLILDGSEITPQRTPLAAGWAVARVQLGAGVDGAHLLQATEPIGIQVSGYGFATSYQYPGGLDLKGIAPPPPVIPPVF